MAAKTGRQLLTAACLLIAGVTAYADDIADRATSAVSGAADSVQVQQFQPVRTDSPRQTFETFLNISRELDQIVAEVGLDSASDDRAAFERTLLLTEQAVSLIDLSMLPEGSQREIGSSIVAYLLDIFGRVELPETESIPGDHDADMPLSWRVPNTPIRIVRVSEGSRKDEYLFSAETHRDALRFYQGIRHLPLRSEAGVKSWTKVLPQITGPMIPMRVVRAIPEPLRSLWLDTPIWKILIVSVFLVGLLALIIMLYRIISPEKATNPAAVMTRRSLIPLVIMLIVWWIEPLISYELNISGAFWVIVSNILVAVTYLAAGWLFWCVTQALFERVIQFRAIDREKENIQLVLIGAKTLAILGVIVIVSSGAQALGLPVYSIVAGLGIGGIAVALSIHPTLENLIGGMLLYLDRPVRVGDYCSFGDKRGTVERIGIRTIKIRGIDRTLITIPNAKFANMELINWAECDMMLIVTTFGLRYETDSDQLRYVLVKIREMCHAHPAIDSDTVRIRLSDFGPSSIDINVRVYALTREWNEFFAIREDVFLRIKDIVSESGARFALPSQTIHVTRDRGMDSERGATAASKVETWRRSGQLPFPALSAKRIAELEGTLDWPPRGSFDSDLAEPESAEPLSADNIEEEHDESER